MLDIIKAAWNDIQSVIKNDPDIPDVSYTTWIAPLSPIGEKDGTLSLLLESGERYAISFIEKKYKHRLIEAIKTVTGIDCDISIVIPAATQLSGSVPEPSIAPSDYAATNLNPKYTFDNFVVGNNNKLAHAAALAVAEAPGEIYNPLFIYGGVGLGKTHLMQAIAHFVLKEKPDAKVLYVSCEQFTNELVNAIYQKNASTTSFHEKYRSVDVLLIDDIQFIAKRERTEEEIFNTFNTLYNANKAIVFASDRPPRDIDNIDERMRSRFLSGFQVDISLPDFETRMAILRKKEDFDGLNIDNSVITYIAENVKSNIRELEGALTKIVGYSRLTNKEITLDLAHEALKDHIMETKTEITPERIINVVAEHFNISPADLSSEKRSKSIAGPRHISMYLCCILTNASLLDIARSHGKSDHSTVIHGREKITEELKENAALRNTIDVLKKKLSPSG